MANLRKTIDRLSNGAAFVAGICLIILVVIVNLAAVSRFFFGRPWGWSVEMSEFLLLFITFLAAAWILKKDSHVRVDVVLNFISEKWRKMMYALTDKVMVVFFAITAIGGGIITYNNYIRGITTITTLRTPRYIFIGIITIGFILLFLQGLAGYEKEE